MANFPINSISQSSVYAQHYVSASVSLNSKNQTPNTIPSTNNAADIEDNLKKESSNEKTSSTEELDETESSATSGELTPEEQQISQELAKRDREVRAHETAHMAAGGGLTGGASYTYEIGPDGQRYAVGGEVSIDTSPVPNDAQATLAKANRIQAAALAPAQPSNQDRAVASAAAAMAAEARAAIMSERLNGDEDSDRSSNNSPEETSHDASNSSSPTELSSKEANSENTPLAESSSAKSLAIETYQQTIDNPTGAPSISQTINIVA